jgi:hypothetical protein
MSKRAPPQAGSLVELLRDLGSRPVRLVRTTDPLHASHLARATEEVVRLLGDRAAKPPTRRELDETLAALRAAWKTEGSVAGVSQRDLRLAPWVFFYPRSPTKAWLANDEGFVRAWLGWLDERRNVRATVALMREFLSVYPEGEPVFEVIRLGLRKQLKHGTSPRLVRWREKCGQFGLLDKGGPVRFAEAWRSEGRSFDDWIEAAGLRGLDASVFLEKATERVLAQTEKALQRDDARLPDLERSLAWLEREGKLRFESQRVAIATAVLAPFLEREPKPAIQDQIRGFLCRTIGDPRIQRQSWQGVAEPIRGVLFGWLVRETIDDFLRVIDQTAGKEHWRYRKAFWTAYLERGEIPHAWVAFGPEAGTIARKGLSKEGSTAARLYGNGVSADHSVLLLQIRELTIAEWSHNGTCRIWLKGNRTAPKLYEAQYSRESLMRGSDLSQTHQVSERGTWQGKVASYIHDNTSIRLGSADYMPKRVLRR